MFLALPDESVIAYALDTDDVGRAGLENFGFWPRNYVADSPKTI